MATTVTAGTDHTLTATLTDANGDAVTGAIGTVTVETVWGRGIGGIDWPEDLTDENDGTYTYTLPGSALRGGYHYQVTASFTDPGAAEAKLTLICTH